MIVVNARFLTQQVTGVQRFSIELSIRLKRPSGQDLVCILGVKLVSWLLKI